MRPAAGSRGMRAVRYHEAGDPSVLSVEDVDRPDPAADELLASFAGEMSKDELASARELAQELRAKDRMLVALDQRASAR